MEVTDAGVSFSVPIRSEPREQNVTSGGCGETAQRKCSQPRVSGCRTCWHRAVNQSTRDRDRTTLTFAWDAGFLDDPAICVSTGRLTLYLERRKHEEEQLVTACDTGTGGSSTQSKYDVFVGQKITYIFVPSLRTLSP